MRINLKTIKACIDLNYLLEEKRLPALFNAFHERTENIINEKTKEIISMDDTIYDILRDSKEKLDSKDLLSEKKQSRKKLFELALWRGKLWAKGKILNVKFLNGNNYLHRKVIHFAKKWEEYANIKFNFIRSGQAEIRVAFMTGKGSWSYIGTDALSHSDQTIPTMNFGWFDASTKDEEFSRTVIHEFGHCLGCIHEHQSPVGDIKWNKPYVYAYYLKTQGWNKEMVDHNLFNKFNRSEISNSEFDRFSIMLYPIPRQFTTDGFFVGLNSTLSPNDIQFIKKSYPN